MIEFTASCIARFWGKVNFAGRDDCWLWTGGKDTYGYGRFGITHRRMIGAHKMAYMLANGLIEIPKGGIICHHCDNPPCCNPRHLYLGDKSSNAKDYYSRHRNNLRRGESNHNHRLTVDQVLEIRKKYLAGVKQKELASTYGVHVNTISKIVRGLAWKDVS